VNLLDVVSRDTLLHKVANTDGGEYAGPCPWCGGEDRFHMWPQGDWPHYWCRICGRRGDAIQYLREREGLTFRQACDRLGEPVPERSRLRSTLRPPPLATPPSLTWRPRAHDFSEGCERTLWTPARAQALGYLHQRGLTDETIRAARLGYHAAERWERPACWGLPTDHKKIHLLQGILLPWRVGLEVWRVTFRRDGHDISKEERYRPIAGGGKPLYQINALRPNAPAMLVEGELDALAVTQEAGDLLAVWNAGSAGSPCARLYSWRSTPIRLVTRLRPGG
jgi:DNA primase